MSHPLSPAPDARFRGSGGYKRHGHGLTALIAVPKPQAMHGRHHPPVHLCSRTQVVWETKQPSNTPPVSLEQIVSILLKWAQAWLSPSLLLPFYFELQNYYQM